MIDDDKPFDPDDNADLLGDDAPLMLDPAEVEAAKATTDAVDWLRGKGLRTVGDARWLDPDNEAPEVRALLTVPNALGSREVAFMPAGKVAMLVAPGGTGKSQALVQLAVSVASGKKWLGTYNVANPGPVLLALGEEDADEMHRRIRGAVGAMGWDAAPEVARNLHALSLCGERAMLVDDKGGDAEFGTTLRDGLAAWPGVDGWRLIILDPASRFLGPDAETDNAQATRFIEAVERLTRLPGNPTVLFAHHTNKGGLAGETDQGAARGSSGLTDGARWQANLDRCHEDPTKEDRDAKRKGKLIPDEVILRMVKANHCPVAEPLRLKRDLDRGGFMAPLDPTTTAARATAAAKVPAESAALRKAKDTVAVAEKREKALVQEVADFKAKGDTAALDKATRELDKVRADLRTKHKPALEALSKPASGGKVDARSRAAGNTHDFD